MERELGAGEEVRVRDQVVREPAGGIDIYNLIVSIISAISMISKMSIISIYVGGDAQHDLQPQLRHRLTNFGNLI